MTKVGIIIYWETSEQDWSKSKEWLKNKIKKEHASLDEFLDKNIIEWEDVHGIMIKD